MTTLSELIDALIEKHKPKFTHDIYLKRIDITEPITLAELEELKQALPQHDQEVINNALMAARIAGFEDYKKTELDLAQEKAKWQAEAYEQVKNIADNLDVFVFENGEEVFATKELMQKATEQHHITNYGWRERQVHGLGQKIITIINRENNNSEMKSIQAKGETNKA